MSGAGNSEVTQLEFHQAMNDFKNMFPEMEEDVIEAVLRANNGVVDATIDQLLQMNNESQKKKAALTHKKENMLNQSNIYNVESSSKDSKSYSKNLQFTKVSKDSLRYKNRWDPPLLGELSPSFLRINLNETQRKLSTLDLNKSDAHLISSSFLQQKMEENERNRQITSLNDDPELAQFLEDERFAILLQNEEFVRELRLNHDFMSTLESDSNLASGSNAADGIGHSSNFADSDAAFREKLRNMGKVSKRKFIQLARLFSGRTKRNFKQLDESTSRDPYFSDDLNDGFYVEGGGREDKSKKTNLKF